MALFGKVHGFISDVNLRYFFFLKAHLNVDYLENVHFIEFAENLSTFTTLKQSFLYKEIVGFFIYTSASLCSVVCMDLYPFHKSSNMLQFFEVSDH